MKLALFYVYCIQIFFIFLENLCIPGLCCPVLITVLPAAGLSILSVLLYFIALVDAVRYADTLRIFPARACVCVWDVIF